MNLRGSAILGLIAFLEVTCFSARPVFESMPDAQLELSGSVGDRIRANHEHWLLCAPQANPGMLEMFRLRDRKPVPQWVPWAGEFIGKYLISAIQGLQLMNDPRLRRQVADRIAELVSTQAEDGYLGPFPKADRLLKNWDLWGHYHVIQALVMWHEYSGDAPALAAARKAADLICATYLDTGRRVFDAGDPEMNMAILTALAELHRLTGDPRYLQLALEVEKDWERAGDYLRAGLDGREFYRSPKPRWESLHSLQGLVELWRITGDAKYREAFEHHWRSIRRWDRRNTGGFSSGEQATGNPYAPTAIETCCTVAWMALTIDYLRLTGDARAAGDLELATLNGGLGAQHPSGRWWTYNTPMDGVREASAHTIVFQARAGTPDLNCCSVNGPRILGMLAEWAVMSDADGLVVNWLGSGMYSLLLAGHEHVTLRAKGDAWRDGRIEWDFATAVHHELTLRIRIPGWARMPKLLLNGSIVGQAIPGTYFTMRQRWKTNDVLILECDLPVRFVAGANEAANKVSLYYGPLLLAYDQASNPFDEESIPPIDLTRLDQARVVSASPSQTDRGLLPPPWLILEVPTTASGVIRVIDFANAGAGGTRYRSWLPAEPASPPPAFTVSPPDMAQIPVGPLNFRWRGARDPGVSYRVEFATNEAFTVGMVAFTNTTGTRMHFDTARLTSGLADFGKPIWWRVVSRASGRETVAEVPPSWFRLDPSMPLPEPTPEPKIGPNGEIIAHALRNNTRPEFGEFKSVGDPICGPEGAELNGQNQMLIYGLDSWPDGDFSVSVRVRIRKLPDQRIGQIFSAWTSGMDDPLRLVVDGGKLYARVEAGTVFSTPGAVIVADRWHAVAAVKRGASLVLYLDGRTVGSCLVPEFFNTRAQDCALGGNPHYSGKECLAACFADFRLYHRALSEEELRAMASTVEH